MVAPGGLRWSPAVASSDEESAVFTDKQASSVASQPLTDLEDEEAQRSEAYVVTYCEHFQAASVGVAFCVKRWRERPMGPARYELSVECELPSSEMCAASAHSLRPALIWDVFGRSALDWSPPWLPATDGSHEEDRAQCYVKTCFVATGAPCRWRLTMVWPYDRQAFRKHRTPGRLAAMLGMPDGRRIGHPAHGRTFQIFIREDSSVRHSCRNELQEAEAELARQRALCETAEAASTYWADRVRALDALLMQRPSEEVVAELRTQLSNEVRLRERCSAELEELRSQPRTPCSARRKHLSGLIEENLRLRASLDEKVSPRRKPTAAGCVSRWSPTRLNATDRHVLGEMQPSARA